MTKDAKFYYRQLDRKGDFTKAAAEAFGVTEGTIKSHWISNENIPAEHQKDFLRMVKRAVRKQEKYLKSLK